jgi:hypothetical protein
MKKVILYTFCVTIIFTTALYAQTSFAFGVKPGIGLNGAYFGVNINGNAVPFVGFDYFGVNGSFEETGLQYDYNLGQLINYSDKGEASASVYNLSIGVRAFFMTVGDLKPYFTGTFFKPFISAEVKQDGEIDHDVSDAVDNISVWGFSLGFGTEYYFSKNFSVGGEFGIRFFMGSFEQTDKVDVYDPGTGTYRETDRNYNLDLNLQLTYSVVTLNYYF